MPSWPDSVGSEPGWLLQPKDLLGGRVALLESLLGEVLEQARLPGKAAGPTASME